MNELQIALNGTDSDLENYLIETSIADFKSHISQLLKIHADKGAIKLAIESLQKLL